MEDNKGKVKYCCVRCKKEKLNRPADHFKTCKKSIEDLDYVKCKICGYKALALYSHVKKHNLTLEEYEEKYGSGICDFTRLNISIRNSITNGKYNYRNTLRKEGRLEELEQFNKKTSQSVSNAIMANPEERERRAKLLGQLNKREDFRRRASETAIKTSARKEIIEQRTNQLMKWMKEKPEEHFEKCVSRMLETYHSKPEKELFEICKKINNNFKRNQFIKHENFKTKTKRRQIDIFNEDKKIIIEFDGEFHFKKLFEKFDFEKQKLKDEVFNTTLSKEYCIIRVSYDQFSYSLSNYGFKEECVERIKEIILNPVPGLYFIGEAYENL